MSFCYHPYISYLLDNPPVHIFCWTVKICTFYVILREVDVRICTLQCIPSTCSKSNTVHYYVYFWHGSVIVNVWYFPWWTISSLSFQIPFTLFWETLPVNQSVPPSWFHSFQWMWSGFNIYIYFVRLSWVREFVE